MIYAYDDHHCKLSWGQCCSVGCIGVSPVIYAKKAHQLLAPAPCITPPLSVEQMITVFGYMPVCFNALVMLPTASSTVCECMVYGVRCMSVWCMVYGVWCMVCGVWCMVYGVCLYSTLYLYEQYHCTCCCHRHVHPSILLRYVHKAVDPLLRGLQRNMHRRK
jgi:hypothetical protein